MQIYIAVFKNANFLTYFNIKINKNYSKSLVLPQNLSKLEFIA